MTGNRTELATLRPNRLEFTRLGWALALSLVLHLAFWGVYVLGRNIHWPAWMQKLVQTPPVQAKQQQPSRPPLLFVDVTEAQAVPKEPKDAKHYSDRNSIAANPDLNKELNEPKLDGSQESTPKTDASSQKKFDQLMPDPPKPKPVSGNMTIAKVDLKPPQEKKRPRTIKEALLQRGEQLKQDGGATQRPNASLDVKATGFGAYDRAFIDAVSSRWYDLLDNMSYDAYRQGKVVVQFVLNYDGRITEMKVVESTVTETLSLLCQKAVLDPAPFDKWPREMRLMVGEDSRRITFTFNYN